MFNVPDREYLHVYSKEQRCPFKLYFFIDVHLYCVFWKNITLKCKQTYTLNLFVAWEAKSRAKKHINHISEEMSQLKFS